MVKRLWRSWTTTALTALLQDQQDFPYEVIELADRIPTVGNTNLITSEAQTTRNSVRVHAFLEAANPGWYYALDHPEEMMILSCKKIPRNPLGGQLTTLPAFSGDLYRVE